MFYEVQSNLYITATLETWGSGRLILVCYTAVFSVVTQPSPQRGGALRDDTKNGCVADKLNTGGS